MKAVRRVRGCGRPATAAAVLALVLACGSRDEPAKPSKQAAAKAAPPSPLAVAPEGRKTMPPTAEFVAPVPWQSAREGTPPVPPPALETWRALVNQNKPHQIETPKWQPLAPRDLVELAMPPGSGFRCVVTPLRVTSQANDFGTKLKAWLLVRTLLCSADDFRSWTEYPYTLRLLPDGTREAPAEAGALLRERGAAGVVRHSFVLLRSDEERTAATTGQPQIVEGVPVDDD